MNEYLNLHLLFTWEKALHREALASWFLIFYDVCHLQVHVQAVLSILLATFAGFGVVMSGSSMLVEFFRWRRRWQASLEQQHGPLPMTQAGQQPRTVTTPRSGQSNHNQSVVQNQQDSNQNWIDSFLHLMTKLVAAELFVYRVGGS